MIIEEISIKNFKSFGNSEQTLKMNTEGGELILLMGNNGNGKSLVKETQIEVDFPIELFDLEDFVNFLDIMGEENKYILYIEKKNKTLYGEYNEYINKQRGT